MWFGGGKLAADLTLPKLRCRWDPARTRAAERFTAAERNAIWEHAARTADVAARNIRFTGPDDPAAADAAWAAADTLHAAAAALGSRVLRQAADSFDRAARAPYGRVPPVVAPDGIGLRRSARLLSLAASAGDETVRAQMRLVLQLSRLARAVAELREAQRHAAQAAAARQAAEELRAAWRASTSWSPRSWPARAPWPSGSAWTSRSRRARSGPEPGRKPARTALGHVPHTGRQHPRGAVRADSRAGGYTRQHSRKNHRVSATTTACMKCPCLGRMVGGSVETEFTALDGGGERPPLVAAERQRSARPGPSSRARHGCPRAAIGDFDAVAAVAAAVAALAPDGVRLGCGPSLLSNLPDQVS